MNIFWGIVIFSIFVYFIYAIIKQFNTNRAKHIFKELPRDFLKSFDMNFVKYNYKLRKENEDFNESIDEITWNDLDMDTVFKRINYSETTLGEFYLYYKLREVRHDKKEWEGLEKLIEVFTYNESLRDKISSYLSKIGKLNDFNFTNSMYSHNFIKVKGFYKYVVLSLCLLLSVILSFVYTKIGVVLTFIFFCTNIFFYNSAKILLENKFNLITYSIKNIDFCRKVLKLKEKDLNFLNEEVKGTLKRFKDLNKIRFYANNFNSNKVFINEFQMILDYIKMLFMGDILFYQSSVKILEKNKEELYKIYDIVSKIDFALSIAYYRASLKEYSIPEFTQNEEVELENAYHPLIEEPVKNSIVIKNNIIFTGSNASGKSTFIKAIALNCILAQSLNTALCTSYKSKISKVMTSMAVRDDVVSGDSYFIAEIKSLKRLIDSLNDDVRVLAFVDEILKGTNTLERISSSAAILDYVKRTKAKLLVATHDMELTDMVSGYDNYHFRETVTDDEVTFDYKLRSGPSKTRNALKLLKVMDFDDDVISLANNLYNDFIKTEKWNRL